MNNKDKIQLINIDVSKQFPPSSQFGSSANNGIMATRKERNNSD